MAVSLAGHYVRLDQSKDQLHRHKARFSYLAVAAGDAGYDLTTTDRVRLYLLPGDAGHDNVAGNAPALATPSPSGPAQIDSWGSLSAPRSPKDDRGTGQEMAAPITSQ